MILIIDNYDSFTYNLFQMVGEILQGLNHDLNNSPSKDKFNRNDLNLGEKSNLSEQGRLSDINVIKNDEMNLSQIMELNPDRIIISPGPGNPNNERDFGVCKSVIMSLGKKIPILGVCLGHQGIFSTFGGKIIKGEPVHGKQSEIFHTNDGIFEGVSNPLVTTRYHSLICDVQSIPKNIQITSKTVDNIIMSLRHINYPIFGLQFHPESIGTKEGQIIIKNFLVRNYE